MLNDQGIAFTESRAMVYEVEEVDDAAEMDAAIADSRIEAEQRVLRAIRDDVDFSRYNEIRRKCAKEKWRKFLIGLTGWLRSKFAKADMLGLVGAPPMRVLDIGCGPGHFGFLCRYLGHDVIGMDVPGDKLFQAMNGLFETRFVEAPVAPQSPLPVAGPFDLIVAMSANFYRRPDATLFTIEDWRYFLTDAVSRLSPGGRIDLHLNELRKAPGLHIGDEEFAGLIAEFRGELDLSRRTVSIARDHVIAYCLRE
jgi:SAM-dependent methyltransferase